MLNGDEVKYCKDCDKTYPDDKKFCSDCGKELTTMVEVKEFEPVVQKPAGMSFFRKIGITIIVLIVLAGVGLGLLGRFKLPTGEVTYAGDTTVPYTTTTLVDTTIPVTTTLTLTTTTTTIMTTTTILETTSTTVPTTTESTTTTTTIFTTTTTVQTQYQSCIRGIFDKECEKYNLIYTDYSSAVGFVTCTDDGAYTWEDIGDESKYLQVYAPTRTLEIKCGTYQEPTGKEKCIEDYFGELCQTEGLIYTDYSKAVGFITCTDDGIYIFGDISDSSKYKQVYVSQGAIDSRCPQ